MGRALYGGWPWNALLTGAAREGVPAGQQRRRDQRGWSWGGGAERWSQAPLLPQQGPPLQRGFQDRQLASNPLNPCWFNDNQERCAWR